MAGDRSGRRRCGALRGGAALTPGRTRFDCEARLCDAPGLGRALRGPRSIDLIWRVVPRTAADGSELEVGERCVGQYRIDAALRVAAQHDIGAAACHVSGDRNHAGATGLRYDVGLAGVLFGIE